MSTEHRVRVENGKYTFVDIDGDRVDVLRYGEPWFQDIDAGKAIGQMMAELDAARVVMMAVREVTSSHTATPKAELKRALERYDSLVDDREPPSAWTAAKP